MNVLFRTLFSTKYVCIFVCSFDELIPNFVLQIMLVRNNILRIHSWHCVNPNKLGEEKPNCTKLKLVVMTIMCFGINGDHVELTQLALTYL